MVECTNFPLDEEDCKSCKEYPCSLVSTRNKIVESIDKDVLTIISFIGLLLGIPLVGLIDYWLGITFSIICGIIFSYLCIK